MHTFTWSWVVSRSASGSRWPGTDPNSVVAAVSSVTSLLRAVFGRCPLACNLPPAARDEKCAAPPARPRTTRLSGRPANPVDLFKRSETRVHRAVSARNPGFIAWTNPEGLGLLGLPEDLVDLVDLGQQFVRLGDVGAALGATSAGQLGGLVEQRVQLGVLLEVRRLEVVRPQHPQVVLDQLGPLFLDQDGAGPELGVRVLRVLLVDAFDRFRLDPGLRRVIDSAGQVAVGVSDDLRLEQAGEQPHRFPFSDLLTCRPDTTPLASDDTGRDGCTGPSSGSRWPNVPCCPPCTPVTGSWSAAPAASAPARSSSLATPA